MQLEHVFTIETYETVHSFYVLSRNSCMCIQPGMHLQSSRLTAHIFHFSSCMCVQPLMHPRCRNMHAHVYSDRLTYFMQPRATVHYLYVAASIKRLGSHSPMLDAATWFVQFIHIFQYIVLCIIGCIHFHAASWDLTRWCWLESESYTIIQINVWFTSCRV